MTNVFEPAGSCMSSAMTCTLLSVLITNGSAGSALSFGWMKMLLRDECLMQWSEIMGLSHTRWKDQLEEALTSLGVTNWRRRVQSRVAWREASRQATLEVGLQS